MIRFPTKEAEDLRRSEVSQALTFAVAFGVLTLIATIWAMIFGWVYTLPNWLPMAVFFIGGAGVCLVLVTGLRRGRRVVWRVVDVAERWLNAEIKLKTAAPPALPYTTAALPPGDETIKTNINGRAGEIARETVHGFEPDDLKWLCKYLATGGSWTEAVMENIPLPYSGDKLGKAQGQTPYNRAFGTEPPGLMLRAGIIEGRGGPGNSKGKLVIKDKDEMYQRIKALPAESD